MHLRFIAWVKKDRDRSERPAYLEAVSQISGIHGTDSEVINGVEGAVNHKGNIETGERGEDKAMSADILKSPNQCKGEVLLMVCVPLGEDVPALVAHKDVVGTPLVHVGQAQFEIAARLHQPAASHHRHIVAVEGEIELVA